MLSVSATRAIPFVSKHELFGIFDLQDFVFDRYLVDIDTFGPIFNAGRRGLLTVLLSVTRPHAQPCFAAIWPKLWDGHRGLLPMPPF